MSGINNLLHVCSNFNYSSSAKLAGDIKLSSFFTIYQLSSQVLKTIISALVGLESAAYPRVNEPGHGGDSGVHKEVLHCQLNVEHIMDFVQELGS